jgi:hypothetical protein
MMGSVRGEVRKRGVRVVGSGGQFTRGGAGEAGGGVLCGVSGGRPEIRSGPWECVHLRVWQ